MAKRISRAAKAQLKRQERALRMKPKGESKYAKKVKARRRLAAELGLPDMPYPILHLYHNEE